MTKPKSPVRWFKAKLTSLTLVDGKAEKHIVYSHARDRVQALKTFSIPGFNARIKEVTYEDVVSEISK